MTAPTGAVVFPAVLVSRPRATAEQFCRRYVRGRACMFGRGHAGGCLPAPNRKPTRQQETTKEQP